MNDKTEWAKDRLRNRLDAVCKTIVVLEEGQAKYPRKSMANLGYEPLLLARREEREWLNFMIRGLE